MKVILYGLPGSGKKTLIDQLSKHFNIEAYYDFYDGEIKFDENLDFSVFTFIQNTKRIINNIDIFKEKLLLIFLPEIWEETEDSRYSEYFGIDIKYIYEQNPFKGQEEGYVGNYGIITYDYNFNTLKEKIKSFMGSKKDTKEELVKFLQTLHSLDRIPFVPNFDLITK